MALYLVRAVAPWRRCWAGCILGVELTGRSEELVWMGRKGRLGCEAWTPEVPRTEPGTAAGRAWARLVLPHLSWVALGRACRPVEVM